MDYISHQAPLSMGLSKQEYWTGLPFLFPGGFPQPGIKLTSPALASGFFTAESPEKPVSRYEHSVIQNLIPELHSRTSQIKLQADAEYILIWYQSSSCFIVQAPILFCVLFTLIHDKSGRESACQCRRHNRCRLDPRVGKVPWRMAWQLTPVFLPGKSHGQRSLVGHSPWGCKELAMTEAT